MDVRARRPAVQHLLRPRVENRRSARRSCCTLARVPIRVTLDPERLRPVDVPVIQGDASRIRVGARLGAADPGRADAVGHARMVAGGDARLRQRESISELELPPRKSTPAVLSVGAAALRCALRSAGGSRTDSPGRAPLNGFMMNMCAVAGFVSIGICCAGRVELRAARWPAPSASRRCRRRRGRRRTRAAAKSPPESASRPAAPG